MASKKSYVPAPVISDADLQRRYQVMLSVLTGAMTVSEGARQLGLSRNHFQTLMHRGLFGMIEALAPKLPGRHSTPETEQKLRTENTRLARENTQLRRQVETIERMLSVASQMVRGRAFTGPSRAKRSRKKPTTSPSGGSEEPDEGVAKRLEHARELRHMGLRAPIAAALAGVSSPTLRRWELRSRRGLTLVGRRGPAAGAPTGATLGVRVEGLVRESCGLLGAESLSHAVPGVSRRQAAAIKHEVLTTMRRERVAAATRVVVTTAGVMRGFDAMHVATTAGMRYLLCSADASVPFRTSAPTVEHYDEASVARAVEQDFALHGVPLVWRADRARCHDAPKVRSVLAANDVLVLHGPPHYPGFYGQLERQNREQRAWLDALGVLPADELDAAVARMLRVLNCDWRRRKLGWCTANEVWSARASVPVDRRALRQEVTDRAARIRRQMDVRGAPADQAERFAIEAALTQRGFLRREAGGWC